MRLRVVATAAVLVGAAAAANLGHAETIRVEVKALAFLPRAVSAHVGDVIEWVNHDFVAHTATARNGDWDVNLPPNATGRTEVKRPGTVAYFCRYHPNMTGEITIAQR